MGRNPVERNTLWTVAWSPDGKWLAAFDVDDAGLRLLSLTADPPREWRRVASQEGQLGALAVSPGGKLVALSRVMVAPNASALPRTCGS